MNPATSHELVALQAASLEAASHQVAALESDGRRYLWLGWAVVLAGIAGFLVWAALAPLDKGVPLSGTVTVSTHRKAVQHVTGGSVEAILVKEGDVVKAGGPLVRMNPVLARAAAESIRVQYFTARAAEARLVAERDRRSRVAFPPEVDAMRQDPRMAHTMHLQEQLFTSRLSALRSEIAALDENVAGLQVQASALEQSRSSKREQLDLLQEQLAGVRDLASEGYMPRNKLLELERTRAQLGAAVAEDTGNIGRAQRQIAELRMKRLQRQQAYQTEVRTQLSDVQKDAATMMNKLAGLDHELTNTVVRSPADGVVVAMNVFTHGGVVPAGYRMMDIVPTGDPLVVEGQLPVHLVDKIGPNLPVELIFSAFNQNTTPRVPGIVTHVSADRMVDEKSDTPYYRVKAQVAPEGVQMLAGLQIRPGMPVDLFVKTGERTMLNYLLKPLMDHARMAMKEE